MARPNRLSAPLSRFETTEGAPVRRRPDVFEPAGPGARTGRGFKLREATFKDYEQIASLETRYGLLSKGYDEWRHLWRGNPVYQALGGDWRIGWVLENPQGRIVATMGNIPLVYQFEGRSILAASGRHWVAEPEYRSASLILLDQVVNQKHVMLYVNNTVSAPAAAAVDAIGCVPVPVGLWDESRFWITHYRGFSESLLHWKKCPLAKPLSYPIAAAVFLKDRLANAPVRESDVHVTACSRFDERFDDFWHELKRRQPHLLLAVRTREMLAWHYEHALLDNRLWIMTVVDGRRVLAYATFERKDKPEAGLTRVLLVDFQSLDGSTALLLPLVSRALARCRDEGIHVLENIGRWLEPGELIDAVAPYRRKLSAWSYVYRANDAGLANSLADPRVWAPSLFDGDASLCAGLVINAHEQVLTRDMKPAVDSVCTQY